MAQWKYIMEHYEKGKVCVVEDVNPYESYPASVHMKVNSGSKIRNLMAYAVKKYKEPQTNSITWTGSGSGVTKAVSCAEIMKNKFKEVHQASDIRFTRIEEYWEPKMEGLERLRVNKDMPTISILLSKEALDPSISGYQAPGSSEAFWRKSLAESKVMSDKRKGKKWNSGSAGGYNVDPPSMERKRKRKPQSGKDTKNNQKSDNQHKETKQRQNESAKKDNEKGDKSINKTVVEKDKKPNDCGKDTKSEPT